MTWLWLLAIPFGWALDRVLDRRPWAWRLAYDTGVHRYYEHPDGRRRVEVVRLGYQPINRRWLAGGEWKRVEAIRPPRSPTAVKTGELRSAVVRSGMRIGKWSSIV